MENVVAQMLRCNGHKLYFYSRNDSEHRENDSNAYMLRVRLRYPRKMVKSEQAGVPLYTGVD